MNDSNQINLTLSYKNSNLPNCTGIAGFAAFVDVWNGSLLLLLLLSEFRNTLLPEPKSVLRAKKSSWYSQITLKLGDNIIISMHTILPWVVSAKAGCAGVSEAVLEVLKGTFFLLDVCWPSSCFVPSLEKTVLLAPDTSAFKL